METATKILEFEFWMINTGQKYEDEDITSDLKRPFMAGIEVALRLTKRASDLMDCGHHKDALVKEYNDGKSWCVACVPSNR